MFSFSSHVLVWGVHQAAGGGGQRSHKARHDHGECHYRHVPQPGPEQRWSDHGRRTQAEGGRGQGKGRGEARGVVMVEMSFVLSGMNPNTLKKNMQDTFHHHD